MVKTNSKIERQSPGRAPTVLKEILEIGVTAVHVQSPVGFKVAGNRAEHRVRIRVIRIQRVVHVTAEVNRTHEGGAWAAGNSVTGRFLVVDTRFQIVFAIDLGEIVRDGIWRVRAEEDPALLPRN
jgi:hypothetical protein